MSHCIQNVFNLLSICAKFHFQHMKLYQTKRESQIISILDFIFDEILGIELNCKVGTCGDNFCLSRILSACEYFLEEKHVSKYIAQLQENQACIYN